MDAAVAAVEHSCRLDGGGGCIQESSATASSSSSVYAASTAASDTNSLLVSTSLRLLCLSFTAACAFHPSPH